MPQASPPAVVAAVGSRTPAGLGPSHISPPPTPRGREGYLGSWTGPSNLQAPDSPVRRGAAVLAAPGGGGSMRCPTAPQARASEAEAAAAAAEVVAAAAAAAPRSRPCVSSPLTWAREGGAERSAAR